MRLQELNWMDVERYLEQDNRIILVTGATEQHAYLSLMSDVLIPSKIAEAVAKRENVLVAPPLNFGISYAFGEFPGTISLSKQTFDFVILEIVESLLHQGFHRFFVINGHEGNVVPDRLRDFAMEGLIRVLWFDWWRSESAQNFAAARNLQIDHANWSESFPFNRVAEAPRTPKEPINSDYIDGRFAAREALGDGSYGGPYEIEDAQMYMLFDAVVDEATTLVKSLTDNE